MRFLEWEVITYLGLDLTSVLEARLAAEASSVRHLEFILRVGYGAGY